MEPVNESPQGTRTDLEDDIWGEDGAEDVGHSSQTSDTDLQREWDARRTQFHTLGYRDGISAGKESEAQDGFNLGFKKAVVAGYNWGVARGATSAFAALPATLKRLLLKNEDAVKRLESLAKSISDKSSNDAMRIFYEESVIAQTETAPREGHISTSEMDSVQSSDAEPDKQPTGCCGGSPDCDLKNLSLKPAASDSSTMSDENSQGGSSSNSGACSSAAVSKRNVSRSSGSRNQLEQFERNVELEFKSSAVKLTDFPIL